MKRRTAVTVAMSMLGTVMFTPWAAVTGDASPGVPGGPDAPLTASETALAVPGDDATFYVPLPADVPRAAVANANPATRDRLYETARDHLGTGGARATAEGGTSETVAPDPDAIVIFVDDAGQPILPDHEARMSADKRAVGQGPSASEDAPNEPTFTFTSPINPWEPSEIRKLESTIADFYPVVSEIYGDPAFNLSVNVRKDPSIFFSGLYFASTNEMVLRDADRDVLVHEMIHAFRDDYILGINTWEEGMTRATEVEAFSRLDNYRHWDESHSYGYDVYYEGTNLPSIGNLFGSTAQFALLRYQLAGYAWGKALIENEGFLADFNSALYDRLRHDLNGTRSVEAALLEIAGSVQATVENSRFSTWYVHQGVLNTAPPTGCQLFQRPNDMLISYFCRSSSGAETFQLGASISWEASDAYGTVFASGVETAPPGWIFVSSPVLAGLPPDYKGRMLITASVDTPTGPITQSSYRSARDRGNIPDGIFGVVEGATTGTVKIEPLDGQAPPVEAKVVDGAFIDRTLEEVRGRFMATFARPDGSTITRYFTKDASRYYLFMGETATGTADLAQGSLSEPPTTILAGAQFTISDVVVNNGTFTAGPSFTGYYLSVDGTASPDDVFVGSRPMGSVGTAGEGHGTGSATATVPTSTPAGSYRLVACADYTRKVDENREANNCAASATTVQVENLSIGFVPVADARVSAGAPNTNYGTSTSLRARGGDLPVTSYLTFVVSGLDEAVESATLVLGVTGASVAGGSVHAVSDTTWGEQTITYSNAPAVMPTALSTAGAVGSGDIIELDLGDAISGNGTYSLAVTSDDPIDAVAYASRESSPPPTLRVTEAAPCLDAFEPDGSTTHAHPFPLGTTESHAFCVPGDEDWVFFDAAQGSAYRIETINLAPQNDTYLELYAADGTTLVAADDDGGLDLASLIDFTATTSTRHYVKVRHYSVASGAPELTYELRITAPG